MWVPMGSINYGSDTGKDTESVSPKQVTIDYSTLIVYGLFVMKQVKYLNKDWEGIRY